MYHSGLFQSKLNLDFKIKIGKGGVMEEEKDGRKSEKNLKIFF
jgi:hypothetical protein